MSQFLEVKRAFEKLLMDGIRELFMDNCNGYDRTEQFEATLQKFNTTVLYYPPNTTHLVQPCDTFIS